MFKVVGIFILVFIFWLLWIMVVRAILMSPGRELPQLKERFGTVMWHSSDFNGVFEGSYQNPLAVEHVYCYYPRGAVQNKLVIKRVDSLNDCSNWFGIVVFNEEDWKSEREKYEWN